jgi:hypothetical protein
MEQSLENEIHIGEVYQHMRTGGEYVVFMIARHPQTLKLAVIYGTDDDDSYFWRSLVEFREEFAKRGGSNGG